MPTLVTNAVAAADSAGEGSKDESEILDTSVNLLLDDTIYSESGSESESTVSARTCTNRMTSAKVAPADKCKDDKGRNGAACRARLNPGNEPNGGDDANDETRLSDSDSSIDSPQRNTKSDQQSSTGRQVKNSIHGDKQAQRDVRQQQHGDDESGSDSCLDTPPRPRNSMERSLPSNRNWIIPDDMNETRLSDDNDETRLELSPQDTRRLPPAEGATTQVENTGTRQREQQSGRGVFQARRPMPNDLVWPQQKECDEFRSKFQNMVSDFERRNPRVELRDYQTLSSEEQVKEQQKVINLLDRLGIRKKSLDEEDAINSTLDDTVLDQTCLQDQDMSTTRIDNSPINKQSQPAKQSKKHSSSCLKTSEKTSNGARQSQEKRVSLAAVQLSPIAGASPNHRNSFDHNSSDGFSPKSPNPGGGSPMFADGNSVSELSVEITRGADDDQSVSPFKSPQLQRSDRSNSKRLASTSGKRGKDSFRVKLNEAPRAYSSASEHEGMPPPAPSFHSSDDSFSLVSAHGYEENQGHPFSASQSPIAGTDRRSQNRKQQQSNRDDYRGTSSRSAYRSSDRQEPCRDRSRSQDKYSHRHQNGDRSNRGHDRWSSRHEAPSSRQPEDTYNDRHRADHRSTHRRDNHSSDRHANDDTIDTVNATVFRNPERRPRLKDRTNVRLKEGIPFHYNPLHIKRTKRTSHKERTTKDYPRHHAVDFRDPLGEYMGQEGEELYHVFEWLRDRDNARKAGKWRSDSKGIIFSLEPEQAVNVTLKLLLDSMEREPEEERFSLEDVSSLAGHTLIVVRTKEDIAVWEHALREHTPLSVQNYTDLPSSKRKRQNTASQCATFDIVITTYDALKAQDSTVQLDDDGHVLLGQEADSQAFGGWMTKRVASSPGASSQRMGGFSQRFGGASQRLGGKSQRVDAAATCKQLSVLHRIQWRRIIFTDDLGRKCYLAKQGTARAQAAAAVNGNSRFVFFRKEKEEITAEQSAFESLMRSDKRAIQSVAAALRIETEDEDEDLLDVILDPAQGI